MIYSLPLLNTSCEGERALPTIVLFEMLQATPHLETTLEVAQRHLDCGHDVTVYFWGYKLPYNEPWHTESANSAESSPFARGARLLSPRTKIVTRLPLSAPALRALKNEADQLAFSSFQQLKDTEWRGMDLGMAVVSSLVSNLKCSTFDTATNEVLIRRAALAFMVCYESAMIVLKDVKPDVAYLFNGRFVAQKGILRGLQTSGVKTLLHERGCNASNFALFCKPPHDRRYIQDEINLYWANGLTSAGNRKALDDVASEFYADRRNANPKDWPSFVKEQATNALPWQIRERNGRKLVTYFSSSDDEFEAVSDAFCQEGFPSQKEAVTSLLAAARQFPEYFFVIRLHPHLKQKQSSESQWYLELDTSKNVIILPADSKASSYQLLDESDLVVTYGSTIGIEAAYWGRPSLLLGSTLYDELGSTYTAYSSEKLFEFLSQPNAWLPKDKDGALKYGHFFGSFGIPFKYFKPTGFFSGTFKGVNLHDEGAETGGQQLKRSKLRRIISAVKRRVLRTIAMNLSRLSRNS